MMTARFDPNDGGIPKSEWPFPCKTCGTHILIVTTDAGKRIPLTFEVRPAGRFLWRRMPDGRYSKFHGSSASPGHMYHECKGGTG